MLQRDGPYAEDVEALPGRCQMPRCGAYNVRMRNLTPTQRKSFAAAIVLVAVLICMFVFGDHTAIQRYFSDETLSANHIESDGTGAVEPGTAEEGLRHEVPADLQAVTVVDVIDAETIEVAMEDGPVHSVRLIGLNAPMYTADGSAPGTEEGTRARCFLSETVHPGDRVYLQSDRSDFDKDGNMLRYVWLRQPDSFTDPDEVRSEMLNAIVLDGGYAVARKCKPDDAYFEIFKALQLESFHAERGLWAEGIDWSQGL